MPTTVEQRRRRHVQHLRHHRRRIIHLPRHITTRPQPQRVPMRHIIHTTKPWPRRTRHQRLHPTRRHRPHPRHHRHTSRHRRHISRRQPRPRQHKPLPHHTVAVGHRPTHCRAADRQGGARALPEPDAVRRRDRGAGCRFERRSDRPRVAHGHRARRHRPATRATPSSETASLGGSGHELHRCVRIERRCALRATRDRARNRLHLSRSGTASRDGQRKPHRHEQQRPCRDQVARLVRVADACAGVRPGCSASSSAAAPATCGDAIDVPDIKRRPFAAR